MDDYSVVIGVDRKHLEQLQLTFPTWMKHKPSLAEQTWFVFYDTEQVTSQPIMELLSPVRNLHTVPWPPGGVQYEGNSGDKWSDPQRYKMLSGFVHVPGRSVETKYWLKVDTDVVATGMDDWIDPAWFKGEPGIVSHPWSFTKPPDQMMKLDAWAGDSYDSPSLSLVPTPGSDRLSHPRIISFCGFFQTEMTKAVSARCVTTCGRGKLPVSSQDGVMWYHCMRSNLPIIRPRMKQLGWQQWNTMDNIRQNAAVAMEG